MRLALYHNLPPGGALRTVWEFARRRGDDVACDLFTLDFGVHDPFRYAQSAMRDFSGVVDRIERVPVDAGALGTALAGRAHRLGLLRGIRRAERHIARAIEGGGYDAAVVHGCWFSQTPSLLGDLRVPTMYYMQEVRRATFEPGYYVPPGWSVRSAPGRLVEDTVQRVLRARDIAAAKQPDLILCNSRHSAETIASAYGRDATVSYLGIDERTFVPASGDVPRDNAVTSVGGLERFKGHHLVIEAVAEIPRAERPVVRLVYERCDDAYRRELLDLAAARDVGISEHRAVPDAEVATLLASSRATLLAAEREPLGLVALESIACGTPVVALDEGGYRETVTSGVNGLLVPRGDHGLTEGLRAVLRDELTSSPDEIRASILPDWTWDAAVARQMRQVRGLLASVA